MRYIAILTGLVLVAAAPACAAELEVRSSTDMVTVYPDGATITRLIRVELPAGDTTLIARDFPPGLDPASLRVEGESATRLVIGAIDARAPRPERPVTAPEIEKRIEALRDERAVLDDRIAAETVRKKFAQRFAEHAPFAPGNKGEPRPFAEWRSAFPAIAEEIAAADAPIRDAKLKQREIDRELARLAAELQANPARKMEVRLDLAADGATTALLRVSYTVRGARWVPLYDARLDSGARDRKPALELTRRAEIVQQTGEDWSDVALSLSTVRTAKGGNAPELRPLIVRYDEPRSLAGQLRQDQIAPAPKARGRRTDGVAQEATVEQEAIAETGGFHAVFRIPGRISIGASEGAKSFRVATATLAPDLLVRAAPALDETAYLEATFKHAEDAPLLPGRIALYRDGIYVGRGTMAPTAKDESVRLGFGADDKVKIARTMVRRNQASAGIISSSKIDEREYKITVRNGHDSAIRVTVEDQLPVSEVAEVAVELLPATTSPSERDVRDRRGVLAWTYEVAAGDLRDIRLAWRVRWPADKSVVYDGGRS